MRDTLGRVTELFSRDWRVTVDGLRLEGMDVAFKVEKSTKKEPNTCELRIWNLSSAHRQQLEGLSVKGKNAQGRIRVEIEAGYVGRRHLIFRGDLRRAVTKREGPDLVTEIEGDDGGFSLLRAQVDKSFPAGTPVHYVVQGCARALGVGVGNLAELASDLRTQGGGTFPTGTVLSGPASVELDRVLRSCGYRWSVQNGVLQLQRPGRALGTVAVLLTSDTGLIGRPSADADGTLSLQALLIPDLYPGARVKLDTEDLKGVYGIEKAVYTGSSHGQEWYADLEVKP